MLTTLNKTTGSANDAINRKYEANEISKYTFKPVVNFEAGIAHRAPLLPGLRFDTAVLAEWGRLWMNGYL